MLKIFISSTFRDLSDIRGNLLDHINLTMSAVGMETFIPSGKDSHSLCLTNLDECDIVIFLISSYYGSFIEKCNHKNQCQADCPLKSSKNERISYTHCEYKYAISRNKKHMTYIIDSHWDLVDFLSTKKNLLDIDNQMIVKKFNKLVPNEINHYKKVSKSALNFKREISKSEFYFGLSKNKYKVIFEHLFHNIINWYSRHEITFHLFSGRHSELRDLISKMEENVEVYGVGGVGKTSLIQVALLLYKLKGWDIYCIGKKQTYITGSGYFPFYELNKENCREIQTDTITINDIIDTLPVKISDSQELKDKITQIQNFMAEKSIKLFIDDFHLAEQELYEFVTSTNNIILATKRKISIGKNELNLQGFLENERKEFLDLIMKKFNISIPTSSILRIASITEGHPISMEIIARNYQRINLHQFDEYKAILDLSKDSHFSEFLFRIVQDILGNNSLEFFQHISIINDKIPNNIDINSLKLSYSLENFDSVFCDLIDSGFISKKKNYEDKYMFTYNHVQDVVIKYSDKSSHEFALNYYRYKEKNYEKTIQDIIEDLLHKIFIEPDDVSLQEFVDLSGEIMPNYVDFSRFFLIGEFLIKNLENRRKAIILNILACLNQKLKRYTKAEEYHLESIKLFSSLSEDYLPYGKVELAVALNDFANTKHFSGNFEEAQKLSARAMVLLLSLPSQAEDLFLQKIASCYLTSGIIHHALRKYEDSKVVYLKAKNLYDKLLIKENKRDLDSLSMIHNNLGNLYSDMGNYTDAKIEFESALRIKKDLLRQNPERYLTSYIKSLTNFASLHQKINFLGPLEDWYDELISKFSNIIENNPDVFLIDYVVLLNNLVSYYNQIENSEKALLFTNKAFEQFESLNDSHKDSYSGVLADIYFNSSVTYRLIEEFEESESHALAAIGIYTELCSKHNCIYLPEIMQVKANLAELYNQMGKYHLAKELLDEIEVNIHLLPNSGVNFHLILAQYQENTSDKINASRSFFKTAYMYFKLILDGQYFAKNLFACLNNAIELDAGLLKFDSELIKSSLIFLWKGEKKHPLKSLTNEGKQLLEIMKNLKKIENLTKDHYLKAFQAIEVLFNFHISTF